MNLRGVPFEFARYTSTAGTDQALPDALAVASQADAAVGAAKTGLMTPDLTRRHIAASIAAAAAGTIGGALLGKADSLVTALGSDIATPAYLPLAGTAQLERFLAPGGTITNAVLQKAFANNRSVTFGSADFAVTPGLVVPTNGSLACVGRRAQWIPAGTTGDVITLGGYCDLEGIRLVSKAYRTAGKMVAVTSVGAVVERLYMERGFDGLVVGVDGATDGQGTLCRFHEIEARDFSSVFGDVMRLDGSGFAIHITSFYADHPDFVNGHAPNSNLHLKNTNDIHLNDFNLIRAINGSLLADPGDGQIVNNSTFIGGCFDTSGQAVLIRPSGTGQVCRNQFTNNWYAGSNVACVWIDTNTAGGHASGNTFLQSYVPGNGTAYGFLLDGASTRGTRVSDGQIGSCQIGVVVRNSASDSQFGGLLKIGQDSSDPSRLNGNTYPFFVDATAGETYFHSPVDMRLNTNPGITSGNANVHVNTPFI